MKAAHCAGAFAAWTLLLPLASPAADGMPDGSSQAMSTLMGMDDTAAIGKVMLDQLEAEGGAGRTAFSWDAQGEYGGDYDKVWLKTEGSPDTDGRDDARNELLWDHALSRWWDLQTGVRYDVGHGPGRGWAAIGIQGLAPYWFDVETTLYVGDSGRTAARLQVEHDLLITQRLILQPEIEANFYGRSDAAREIRSGLADTQVGLRLRYEIRRELAPYLGVAWRRTDTGSDDVQWVAGVRIWL